MSNVVIDSKLLELLLAAANLHQQSIGSELDGWPIDDPNPGPWWLDLQTEYEELTEAIDAAHRLWLVAEGSA